MHWTLSLILAGSIAATQAPFITAPNTDGAVAVVEVDPADSLLRAASDKMARGNYRAAADLYRSALRRYPTSMRLSEAMYYEAFARYRGGDLRRARTVLDELKDRYPQQAARGDANTLRTRICGELARQGDSACAEEVSRVSAGAAGSSRSGRGGSGGDCPQGDDEDDSRIAALNALLQMDAERAMPILTTVLARRDRCSERLRRKAVFLVSQHSSRDAADILLAAAKNDPDAEVREQAVFWLSQVRDPRAVEMLIGVVKSDVEYGVREKALFALSQHASATAGAALRSFAESAGQSTELREKAIFWLGQRKGGDQGAYLRALYGKLDEPTLKEKILFALSQQSESGNDSFLLAVANDTKETSELRKKAIFWIGQSSGDLSRLNTLYGTLTDRELKEQLIFALSQRRESAAVDRMMEIAKSDPDRELRKKAIFWLGQSRDPRATAFLSELLK